MPDRPTPSLSLVRRAAGRFLDVHVLLACLVAALLPRRWRLRFLLASARHARWAARLRPFEGLDGVAGQSAYWHFYRATQLGIRFDPVFRHLDRGLVDDALESGQGTLIIGVHAYLIYLMPRFVADSGRAPLVVARNTTLRLLGTCKLPRYLTRTPTMLLSIFRLLGKGEVVCSLIDRGDPEKHAVPVTVGDRKMWLSSPNVRLAREAGARIIFSHIFISAAGELSAAWGAPTPGAEADAILQEFHMFVSAYLGSAEGKSDVALRAERPSERVSQRQIA